MTEVAGLVLSIATTWRTCVQIFDVIDSGKKYGMEYEVLRVKLEVERIRLLAWGEAVGLSELENGRQSPDPRLTSKEVHATVIRLLECIQDLFENSDALQNRYGLRQTTQCSEDPPQSERPPTQSQLILGSVFKRAYDNLRRSAKERQRSTSLARKALWAVHDKKKFQAMVTEIKGFNENLESLFPDVKLRAAEAMRWDIDRSEEIQALQLLQEATAHDHEDISESASVRLETLGVTVTAQSELLQQEKATIPQDEIEDDEETGKENEEEEIGQKTSKGSQEEMDELSKRLKEVELYVAKKSKGALSVFRMGPDETLVRTSGNVEWEGYPGEEPPSRLEMEKMGFVGASHASFGMDPPPAIIIGAKETAHILSIARREFEFFDDEYFVYFDIESDPHYENVNPGTVTVEGFGLECWDYEELFGKPRERKILVTYNKLPVISAKSLLRRLDELHQGVSPVGWNPQQDGLDLKEFVGDMEGMALSEAGWLSRSAAESSDLYSLLNRRDLFADFTSKSSVSEEWRDRQGESIGPWNFFRQIIISKELARRLERYNADSPVSGFTTKVLASLIIADLWFKNVQIKLADIKVDTASITRPLTSQEKAKAEALKNQGNEATKKRQYQGAADLYAEAINLDPTNAVYRSNRSGSLCALGRYEEAFEDALIATNLDPTYAKAWARLGLAQLRLGRGKRAKEALKRAIELAGPHATNAMRQGLIDAEAKIQADITAINSEKDKHKKDVLHKAFLDEDWDISGKAVQAYSLVHERQAEGLILFAERIKWPYLNEVRDYAEDVYSNHIGGQAIPFHLHDWFYGMMLPEKWFSFKIMTALILCTRSIRQALGIAPYYDCGLSLPQASYWRVRTVLGSVLGCLSSVISLNGWIGPCPPVQFVPPVAEEKPRHIRINARRVAPFEYDSDSDDDVVTLSGRHHQFEARWMKPDEEVEPYLSEIEDPDQWIIPEPPVRQVSVCEVKAIQLEKLVRLENVAASATYGELRDQDVEIGTHYRASIIFQMDDSDQPVAYTLYTNPVFVTPPSCYLGPKGDHEVHLRELPKYQRNIWTIERLKDCSPENVDPDNVMIINATGEGAEVLARAWCSERGRNAVIRRARGPCFVCAVRAASKLGLKVGVLIWVS